MTPDKDINPVYTNNEPLCSGERCSQWHGGSTVWFAQCSLMEMVAHRSCACVPALRRDRDKAQALVKAADETIKKMAALANKMAVSDKEIQHALSFLR